MSDQQTHDKELQQDSPEKEELTRALLLYRNALDQAAAQTDIYWENQRKQVLEKLKHPAKRFQVTFAHFAVAAAAMIFLCLFFFLRKGALPVPDFAGGADQQLLVEVERALQQPYPAALAPAGILQDEIEVAAKRHSKKSK
jgi:hypothetical protein